MRRGGKKRGKGDKKRGRKKKKKIDYLRSFNGSTCSLPKFARPRCALRGAP
jgi:hypothetical protein